MGSNTDERQEVTYFVGEEVEHTVCYGMKTLFVVGHPPAHEIMNKAEIHNCEHIYFGTSQSYRPHDVDEHLTWKAIIMRVLDAGYWVTLDFDVEYHHYAVCEDYNSYRRFVPMISVKLPKVLEYNYNATLKIDDATWGMNNPGVWTHHLHSLLDKEHYTHWDQYINDTDVDNE